MVLMACVAVFLSILIIIVLSRYPNGGARASAPAAVAGTAAALQDSGAPHASAASGQAMQRVPAAQINQWIRDKDRAAVLFYAPWCKHCHEMLPKYEKVAEKSSIPMGAVNCDENTKIVSLYGLRGFPTLVRFVDGQQDVGVQDNVR